MAKLVFTFDDGIRTHYDLVRPLFQKYGMTGTFFIPGVRTMWTQRQREIAENDGKDMQEGPLTWGEIAEMDKEGLEVGNHTLTHRNMYLDFSSKCRKEVALLEHEFAEHDIRPAKTFCYPGYHAGPHVAAVLRDLGFRFARIGYLKDNPEEGEPEGGNRPESRPEVYYYTAGESDPMFVNSTGILNDWYGLDHFIEDVENTPKGSVAVFTAHGFARKLRWDRLQRMVQYVADNGHETINFRDMPVTSSL
jgi:peptidoglycan/xylan/chitin deacetylase (PgdA/CDA1 family)